MNTSDICYILDALPVRSEPAAYVLNPRADFNNTGRFRRRFGHREQDSYLKSSEET